MRTLAEFYKDFFTKPDEVSFEDVEKAYAQVLEKCSAKRAFLVMCMFKLKTLDKLPPKRFKTFITVCKAEVVRGIK